MHTLHVNIFCFIKRNNGRVFTHKLSQHIGFSLQDTIAIVKSIQRQNKIDPKITISDDFLEVQMDTGFYVKFIC